MEYNELGSGGVGSAGCAVISMYHVYTTLYGIGDVLYNIDKARRGVLEKVVIKQIIRVKPSLTMGQFKVMYKDTLNGLWNEYDLVTPDQAQALALAYYNKLLADLAALEAAKPC